MSFRVALELFVDLCAPFQWTFSLFFSFLFFLIIGAKVAFFFPPSQPKVEPGEGLDGWVPAAQLSVLLFEMKPF